MSEYLIIGCGFAFAAVIQPGPLQAYLLSSVAQRGWKRTLPAALAPLISDVPIAFLAIFVLSQVPEIMSRILQGGGGSFLIYLAWTSYTRWRDPNTAPIPTKESAPRTIIQAVTVNLLNPNPYLGWSLVLGPAVLNAWQRNPVYSIVLIIAFYATIIVGLVATIILLGTTSFLGPRSRRILVLVSSVALALLGAYLVIRSILT